MLDKIIIFVCVISRKRPRISKCNKYKVNVAATANCFLQQFSMILESGERVGRQITDTFSPLKDISTTLAGASLSRWEIAFETN